MDQRKKFVVVLVALALLFICGIATAPAIGNKGLSSPVGSTPGVGGLLDFVCSNLTLVCRNLDLGKDVSAQPPSCVVGSGSKRGISVLPNGACEFTVKRSGDPLRRLELKLTTGTQVMVALPDDKSFPDGGVKFKSGETVRLNFQRDENHDHKLLITCIGTIACVLAPT